MLDSTRIIPPAETFEAEILPSSSTKWERALEMALRNPLEVWLAAGRVGDVKADLLDETIPFLIWELGLEPVMPYLIDPRRALSVGRAWQRVRGTPQAITTALSWREWVGVVEDDPDGWWDRYQIGLDRVLTAAPDRAALAALARLSQPAHTDLIRVYHGYDLRALKVNGAGKVNGGALVNDWSGIWLDTKTGPVKFSFGLTRIDRAEQPLTAFSAIGMTAIEACGRYAGFEGFAVNRDRVGGPRLINDMFSPASAITLGAVAQSTFSGRGPYLLGAHADQPWGIPEIDSIGRAGIETRGQRNFGFDEWAARDPFAPLLTNDGKVGAATMHGRRDKGVAVPPTQTHLELLTITDLAGTASIDSPGIMVDRDHVNSAGLAGPAAVASAHRVAVSRIEFKKITLGLTKPVTGWPQFDWPDRPVGTWGMGSISLLKVERRI